MRQSQWCLYTSSYDRGLEHLLKMWPEVKKAVPKAELHIFYGWQLFDRFYKDNPGSMAWKKRMEEMMQADGITHHGRVSQPDIEDWYKKCGVWAYPTHFGEISCISAMKAQTWGAIPVVVDYAALQTTVQHGVKVKGDIYDKETQENYRKMLVGMLSDNKLQEKIRPEMMRWAQSTFGWDKIASQWSDEFSRDNLKEAMDYVLSVDKSVDKYMPVQLQEAHGRQQTY